jgi:hypothetical protein
MTARLLSVLFVVGLAVPAAAQTPPEPGAAQDGPPQSRRLRVYLDCEGCFAEYLRSEIDWVDFVHQPQDADVDLLATVQETGGGGRETVFRLVGAGRYQGIDRELRAVTVTGEPEDVRRRATLRAVTVGLLGYLAVDGLPDGMDVDVEAAPAAATSAPFADAWNAWVFSLRGSMSGSAEQTSREAEWGMSASGDRVTDAWKLSFGLRTETRTERFDLDEEEPLETERRSREFDWFAARSLGPHWSLGLEGEVGSSTFGNTRFEASVGPAIEYSVFPYQEYATRQLVAQYQIGVAHAKYNEITLFDKRQETLSRHEVGLRLDQRQRWGSVEASVEWSQYLHDLSKYRFEVDGELSLRIARGLSVDFRGDASRIHDQISLPRRSASPEEVLLRLRQLRSSYEVGFQMSVTYSFGSLFNNVVNPRFPGGL